jgi:hypothetical protein
MDNADRLLEKIKGENLHPIARWRFTMKNVFAWMGFILAVLFGALAFSVILFAIQQIDFNILEHMTHSFFELLLAMVPLLWVISLLAFLAIAISSIRFSKKGYKIPSAALAGLCVASSMLIGTLFFITGGAGWLEKSFATKVHVYESIQEKKTTIWMMPENGYLSGTIASVNGTTFELLDYDDKTWIIDIQDADIVPAVSMEAGEIIKIIGTKTSDTSFKAEKIRPWGGQGKMQRNRPGQ